MKLRRLLFNLHLYIGLAVGLLVSLTGLTGSLLVFSPEIDALLHPRLLRASAPSTARQNSPAVSLDAVLSTVRSAYPEHRLQQILPPGTPEETYEIWLNGRELRVYVDPASGAILGTRSLRGDPVSFLFDFHAHLLAGDAGETVVGTGGLLLIFLGVTGVVLWWPKQLRQGLTVQWRASWKRVNFDLHRVGGILAVPLLLLIALTGAALVFGTFFTEAAYRLTRTPPPPPRPSSTPRPGARPLPLDGLVRAARAALPGLIPTRITPAAKPEAAVVVRGRLPQELHPNGMSFVYLDQYTGAVLRADNALLAPAAPRLLNLRYPVHIGRYGGLFSRLVHVLVGLTPAILFVTGGLMWWNRMSGRRRRAARRDGKSSGAPGLSG
ncbi:MAG: PepSY-associated TM helix domain-containing protein [Armatimonadota bacterium]